MKIEVAKVDLESALVVAGIAVGSGSDLSGHYLFRVVPGEDSKVEILSYNQRIFARAPLTCNCELTEEDKTKAFTVEAWRLDKWLSGVSTGILSLTSDNKGDVVAKAPKSKIHMRSLDPNKFPYWDSLKSNSQDAGEVSTVTLVRALSLSKGFISSDDTNKPEICQVESVNGVLQATDRKALALVEVPFLANTNLRIAGKDVGSVTRFLGLKTETNTITVSTAERPAGQGSGACAFFTRADGSYLGVSKPTLAFPSLKVDQNSPPDAEFEMDMGDFKSAVAILSASAPKNHETVRFRHLDGKIVVSMPSEAGGEDEYPLVPKGDIQNGDLISEGFSIDYPYLEDISEAFGLDSLKIGITKRGKGGFISVKHVDEDTLGGNKYYTVVVWKT